MASLTGMIDRLRRRLETRPAIDQACYRRQVDPARPVQVKTQRLQSLGGITVSIGSNARRFRVQLFCNNPGQGRFWWAAQTDDVTGILIPITGLPLELSEEDHGEAVRGTLYFRAGAAGSLDCNVAEFIYQ